MLRTVVVVLVVIWLFGVISAYTVGGLIHILLLLAIISLLLDVLGGRRAV